jgi:hypothetical protein
VYRYAVDDFSVAKPVSAETVAIRKTVNDVKTAAGTSVDKRANTTIVIDKQTAATATR